MPTHQANMGCDVLNTVMTIPQYKILCHLHVVKMKCASAIVEANNYRDHSS